MNNDEKNLIEINRKLVELLDNLLSLEEWDQSLMLRASARQIKKVRDEAKQLLDEHLSKDEAKQKKSETLPEGYVYVYVLLFQAMSEDLDRWHSTIQSLPGHTLSRPTYRKEEDVRNRIKARGEKRQEGYVKVMVREQDLVSGYAGRAQKDSLDHELVTIKEGGIKRENIVEFVHANEARYEVKSDALYPKTSKEAKQNV